MKNIAAFSTILFVSSSAHAYEWQCNVVLHWKVDNQSGTHEQSMPVDDARSMSDAEGKAVYRAQAKVRSMFSDAMGRRLTFVSHRVVCK